MLGRDDKKVGEASLRQLQQPQPSQLSTIHACSSEPVAPLASQYDVFLPVAQGLPLRLPYEGTDPTLNQAAQVPV